jgi:N-methylhydantoinase A
MTWTVGIDVGGTFTDFVVANDTTQELLPHKSASTPRDPSDGVLRGLGEIAERLGLTQAAFLADVPLIVHGTTVTTNAVLTEQGARTGLLTTRGFRDVLEMRRGVRSRKHLYDNKYVAPRPLVPRDLRLPIVERVDVAGDELTPLDLDSVRAAVETLRREQVEAVAICFMHAYANPEHEQQACAIVAEALPNAFVSVSSDVLPQVRLTNRVSTTAMNAYVGPVLRSYVDQLVARLARTRFTGVLLVMQSNGGVATPDVVARLPVTTVLSGPAAGPVAGLAAARASGGDDCLVIDMGGTSFDASIVKDGEVGLTREGEINRHLISLPMTDIHTIGAGGGSIGWIDEGGLLHMGPQSAGADPGPVAYGRGGTQPTCTDADLLLGYVNPDYFLGGRMKLDAALARQAIEREIAAPLGLGAVEAAAAMYEVINLVMAAGTKDMALQRGYDPRELPLVVAGGAGPVHAGMIALELDIPLVIVPRLSSVFCAFGMLLADLRHDFVRSFSSLWSSFDVDAARVQLDAMVERGLTSLEHEGVPPERRAAVAAADLRYLGQHHEVTVPFAVEELTADGLAGIEESFHRRHEALYGFSSPGRPMEVVNLHATIVGRRPKRAFRESLPVASGAPVPPKGRREAYVSSAGRLESVAVYDGDLLRPGQRLDGPVIVEESTTTVVVPEGFDVELDRSGSFVLRRKEHA